MKHLLFLSLLAVASSAAANTEPTLIVKWGDGEQQQNSFTLSQIREITFNDEEGSMNITMLNGSETSFTESQQWVATLEGDFSAVETIRDIQGLTSIEVFNLNGVKIAEGDKNALQSLPKGAYIVKSGKNAWKVVL